VCVATGHHSANRDVKSSNAWSADTGRTTDKTMGSTLLKAASAYFG